MIVNHGQLFELTIFVSDKKQRSLRTERAKASRIKRTINTAYSRKVLCPPRAVRQMGPCPVRTI